MLELGALIGALNPGWIVDKISRRYSILVAVYIFTIGSILQTAAVEYGMLTFARFLGGVGIGMLSMVAPLYIAEISMSMNPLFLLNNMNGLIKSLLSVLPNAVVRSLFFKSFASC